MKKIYILIILLLFTTACAKEPKMLYGTDGREIPMAFQNFPDIPFPDDSYLSLEDSRTMGNGENWIGNVCFSSGHNAGRIFDFFVSEMPKKGWVEIAVVRAEISQMTYIKNGRAIQILIQTEGRDSAFVTVTAIPNQASIRAIEN